MVAVSAAVTALRDAATEQEVEQVEDTFASERFEFSADSADHDYALEAREAQEEVAEQIVSENALEIELKLRLDTSSSPVELADTMAIELSNAELPSDVQGFDRRAVEQEIREDIKNRISYFDGQEQELKPEKEKEQDKPKDADRTRQEQQDLERKSRRSGGLSAAESEQRRKDLGKQGRDKKRSESRKNPFGRDRTARGPFRARRGTSSGGLRRAGFTFIPS